MTDMVFGAAPAKPGEPILPEWWRTIDRWSLAAVVGLFLIGMLLGLAASPPLAVRNGLEPFHYVWRQAAFGAFALGLLLVVSMMSPTRLRRGAVIAFALAVVAVALLPVFGTDFGKGSVRWYSLRVVSVQPSEFLKPAFAVVAAWLMAASYDIKGPPGKAMSFVLAVALTAVLALQPDFGQAGLVIATWALMYFAAGASITLLGGVGAGVIGAGWYAYQNSEHVARRIDGFLASEVDPRTQIGYATNAIQEGGFLGVGIGNGTREVDAAGRPHRLHHRGGGRGVRADPLPRRHGALHDDRGALAAPAGARARSVHPARRHRARGAARAAVADQHRGRGAAAAGEGHDAAADLLRRLVADRGRAGPRARCSP